LGCSLLADQDSLRRAYRQQCLAWHPDKHQQSAESRQRASTVFARVTAAWRAVGSEQARAKYDLERMVKGGKGEAQRGGRGCGTGGRAGETGASAARGGRGFAAGGACPPDGYDEHGHSCENGDEYACEHNTDYSCEHGCEYSGDYPSERSGAYAGGYDDPERVNIPLGVKTEGLPHLFAGHPKRQQQRWQWQWGSEVPVDL
jgi:curved DNA-binding protein CbpA